MFRLADHPPAAPNVLTIAVQPDEGIHLGFDAKVPDTTQELSKVEMHFHYHEAFPDKPLPDAYERLLLDALNSDATLFARSDEIDYAWRLMDPVLQGWASENAPPLATYPRGSWGPDEADALLACDGRTWYIDG